MVPGGGAIGVGPGRNGRDATGLTDACGVPRGSVYGPGGAGGVGPSGSVGGALEERVEERRGLADAWIRWEEDDL